MKKTLIIVAPFVALTMGSAVLVAQQRPQISSAMSNISGLWNRLDLQGGGSYHGVDMEFPTAQLLPGIAAKLPPEMDQGLGATSEVPLIKAPNGGYYTPAVALAGGPSPTAGHCNTGGGFGGGIDINSAGMNIVQSPDEVVVVRDGAAGGRHIYLNKTMPDLSRIPQGGYSVGHWENGTLIVTTTGMAPGLVSFGRGWKERDTVLTEAYKMSPDGNRLTITYTWTDPKIYIKPHVYSIAFDRYNGVVTENWCDASIDHPENYTSVAPPPASGSPKK